jgi:cytochrome c oxidase cbb3-type subunit 4
MDVNDLRIAFTVISFAVFIGIVLWAYSGKRENEFQEAAQLALDDDSPRVPGASNSRN